jgi:hypothetical protein
VAHAHSHLTKKQDPNDANSKKSLSFEELDEGGNPANQPLTTTTTKKKKKNQMQTQKKKKNGDKSNHQTNFKFSLENIKESISNSVRPSSMSSQASFNNNSNSIDIDNSNSNNNSRIVGAHTTTEADIIETDAQLTKAAAATSNDTVTGVNVNVHDDDDDDGENCDDDDDDDDAAEDTMIRILGYEFDTEGTTACILNWLFKYMAVIFIGMKECVDLFLCRPPFSLSLVYTRMYPFSLY